MIAVIDYGVGNLGSILNMLKKVGAEAKVTCEPSEILEASKIILPGVGHYDYAMKKLDLSGLKGVLDEYALGLKRPVLGVCLGAQLLGKGSEEGDKQGLGWIDMVCRRLPETKGVKVPNMGWRGIALKRPSPLFPSLDDFSRYYFVHSYYMHCSDLSSIIATSMHGIEFTCAVQAHQIFGVQFHPEKSLRYGMGVMKAFSELPCVE